MTWDDVLPLCGPQIQTEMDGVREALDHVRRSHLPSHLRRAKIQVRRASPGTVWIEGYSRLDPIQLPEVVEEVLDCFDGRPTELVLEEVKDKHGIELETDFLIALVDFSVLEDVDSSATDVTSGE